MVRASLAGHERPSGGKPFCDHRHAVAAGATVANIFYNQPLLAEMGRTFGSGAALGLVATVQPKTTALGYGALLRSLWTLVVEERCASRRAAG